MKQPDEYPPTPPRWRILILLLAVATAVTIVLMLVYRPGDPKHDALRAARAATAASAAAGAGGKADVILIAPQRSSSRP